MNNRYVLDACSIIAYLMKEDGADNIEALFDDAIEEKNELFMHKINLYEVFYDTWKSQSEATAINIIESIKKLPVAIIDMISDELMIEAACLKNKYHVSVADSFALATARLYGACLVTSDHHDFDSVDIESEIVFLWIR